MMQDCGKTMSGNLPRPVTQVLKRFFGSILIVILCYRLLCLSCRRNSSRELTKKRRRKRPS